MNKRRRKKKKIPSILNKRRRVASLGRSALPPVQLFTCLTFRPACLYIQCCVYVQTSLDHPQQQLTKDRWISLMKQGRGRRDCCSKTSSSKVARRKNSGLQQQRQRVRALVYNVNYSSDNTQNMCKGSEEEARTGYMEEGWAGWT